MGSGGSVPGHAGQPGAAESQQAEKTPGDTITPSFILSEGLAAIPARLVSKIQRGEYIDMAELLQHNLEALHRGTLLEQSAGTSHPSKRNRREVTDLLSWVQCFGSYTAIVMSAHPEDEATYGLSDPHRG